MNWIEAFTSTPSSPLGEIRNWHDDVLMGWGDEENWDRIAPMPLI